MSDAPALEIEDLRFRYPGHDEVVVDIRRLALGCAEQMLMTGGSGRGKSTLLHLVAGLLEPESGRVRVDGQDVHALRGHARDLFRGEKIGMIFQTFNLLPGFSAAENVMMALMFSRVPRREHRARALQLLDHLGIDRPGADCQSLSIGQQQRVAVARAVAVHPTIVLADEPTASLDPENASASMDLIQRTCVENGAALLCVSHDPSMRDRFDRCEELNALCEAGT